jgi:hypothetical protein
LYVVGDRPWTLWTYHEPLVTLAPCRPHTRTHVVNAPCGNGVRKSWRGRTSHSPTRSWTPSVGRVAPTSAGPGRPQVVVIPGTAFNQPPLGGADFSTTPSSTSTKPDLLETPEKDPTVIVLSGLSTALKGTAGNAPRFHDDLPETRMPCGVYYSCGKHHSCPLLPS